LVDCSIMKKPIGFCWVYIVEFNVYGTIEIFKVRLVENGCMQAYGINYSGTFNHVAKVSIVRVLLSLVVNLDWS